MAKSELIFSCGNYSALAVGRAAHAINGLARFTHAPGEARAARPTLQANVFERWEIAFSVRNLFDVDAREPSLAGRTSAAIPNDLPLAGRNFYGEIRVNF